LGLAGLAVERVALTALGVRIVQLVTDDPEAARCPACRVVSTSGKGWVLTRPHDLPCGGGQVAVQWRKRRWRCRTLDCARQSFTEQVAQVPAGMRTTTRLRTALAVAVEDGRDQSEVAAAHAVSWPTVQRAVVTRGAVELIEPEPVRVLGIDETRRGRPRFAPNPDTGLSEQVTDRWHTGFTDLTGGQGLLGQVEGRAGGDVGAWLAARTQAWRDGVQTVAIDMCAAYRAAVREHLPNATLVVDHFHVVQLANQTLSEVRRRVTAALRGRRVRRDDPEYGIRRRLLRNREDLTDAKFTDMWNRLIDLGQPGHDILSAWIAKEELRALLALARTHPTRHLISTRLWAFYRWCADTTIPELHRLAATIQAWWPQIEAFILTGITNAASEGINRLIKLEARNAFGFRNPVNQRLRSRCASIRAALRPAKPG